MALPADYVERVYAGVLGKLIGVYLGRPFEGWTYDRIMRELGEVWYYVHDRRNVPLVVTDDDISGTFTFLRALADHGNTRDLTPAQIGAGWLNYIIEERTILWWGGMGMSTEHTAYLRLKQGIDAPRSGSMQTNGKVVAEQIGAQIFIDGWALVAPGDPERAADLARRAASVSHDGEAIYGAQVIAAMEAAAFVESGINALIDTAVGFIPRDSIIYRLINDIREWHAGESDWRKARESIAERYGYHIYGGNCHMVPNHALILFSLLYGDDDFQKTLMIVNTSGWDTDCNSGNVGCLMGIKNGLAGINAGPDWRGPVADRLYLPTADGGRAITDAVTETYHVVNMGRALHDLPPLRPKDGARYHFSLPGSVQGFTAQNAHLTNPDGGRLSVNFAHVAPGSPAIISAETFLSPEALHMPGYSLIAAPTLYQGQTIKAQFSATTPVNVRLFVDVYGAGDALERIHGPAAQAGDSTQMLTWTLSDIHSAPVARVGLAILDGGAGRLDLDWLTWDGTPDLTLTRPDHDGTLWRRAWVNGVDIFNDGGEAFRIIQNSGRGLLMTGTRDWTDYTVRADVRPHLARCTGIAARVQGLRRYYGLLLCDDGMARLVKGENTLAEAAFAWAYGRVYDLRLDVAGARVRGWVGQTGLFDVTDDDMPYAGGGVALVIEDGRTDVTTVQVGTVRVD